MTPIGHHLERSLRLVISKLWPKHVCYFSSYSMSIYMIVIRTECTICGQIVCSYCCGCPGQHIALAFSTNNPANYLANNYRKSSYVIATTNEGDRRQWLVLDSRIIEQHHRLLAKTVPAWDRQNLFWTELTPAEVSHHTWTPNWHL